MPFINCEMCLNIKIEPGVSVVADELESINFEKTVGENWRGDGSR